MIRKILNTLIAVFMVICISMPSIGISADNNYINLFNSFSGYSEIANDGRLPDGVTVLRNYRKENLSAYSDSSARYDSALRIGYRAEPIIPFNKLINSNKLHISFDIKATDVNFRNIYIGFYDGRSKPDDPNYFDEFKYSMTIVIERGKIMYMKVDENKTQSVDILAWNRIDSGLTYEANKWYSIDYVFDFEKQELNYYVDGKLLNKTPVGTTAAKGLKSLFFRCEVPKDSDGNEFTGYKEQDAAFIVDNISIDEYRDSYEIGNLKESTVPMDYPYIYISCADEIDAPKKEDISITDADGADIDFIIANSDSRGVLIDVPNPKPKESYTLDMSRIQGTRFGATGRKNIIFNFSGDEDCYFSDTFDSYDEDTFLKKWIPSVEDKVELVSGTDRNYYAKISSAERNSETESSISRVFGNSITANAFIVEASVRATGEFDVAFINADGVKTNILGVQIDGKIGCYTESEGRMSTPYSDLKLTNSNEFEKIKLLVDRINKKFTVTTTSKSYAFDYNYQLEDMFGIEITAKNALGCEICIDDVYIKKPGTSGVCAEFSEDKTYRGAMFYSDGKRTAEGQVLRCVEKTEVINDTTYYNIKKANGTMTVMLDADSGIECDGIKNICFDIEYLDVGYGWFLIEYDASDGTKCMDAVCMTDSGDVKKESVIINDWVKNTSGGYRFKIKTYTDISDGRAYSNNYNYSKYPVIIKSVRLSDVGTTAEIKMTVTTAESGNIFFENQIPTFDISLENTSDNDRDAVCKIMVYDKNKNQGDSLIFSTEFDTRTDSETKDIKVAIPINKYGLYTLKAEISGSGFWSEANTEFSKCTSVSSQNYSIGACEHFTRYGDAKTGAELLKKAGMGLIRDDFTWREYEKQKGVYALTERQQKLCEAAAEYNLKLLPIVYGNNRKYDEKEETASGFVSESAMPNYLEFVKRILSEEKLQQVSDMVEVWNEPDLKKTRDGEFISSYEKRGEIYGNILKQSAIAIKQVNEKTGSSYKIGAFCLSNLASDNGKRFMDKALEQLKGGNYFDTVTLHPYMLPSVDPERGKQGEDTQVPYDYIGYRINYIKALVTGGTVYNDVTGEDDEPVGIVTGNKYGFKLSEPLWHTEHGVSSAKYDSDRLCVGNQYSQASWIIRGLNQIRLNNFDDKVWLYEFADGGDRINERELNFGIVRSHTNSVPYAAKYAYLALAAFNKMTENAESASEVYSDDYKYIARYHSNDRDSYLLWTSKMTEQTIDYDFKQDVKFYDLLGNEISKESVMRNGKYILSGEPYWAVEGDVPTSCEVNSNMPHIFYMKNGIGIDEITDKESTDKCDILADLSGTGGGDRVLFAAAYKDNMLKEIKPYKVKEGASFQIFRDIGFDESDINKIKIMLCDGMTGIKPLCVPLEN